MIIFQHYTHLKESRPTAVGIGNFDGVHRGHLALIEHTRRQAQLLKCVSTILTFDPHPVRFFHQSSEPRAIYSTKDRLSLLDHLGIQSVLIQEFNHEFAALSPKMFFEEVLVKSLKARALLVGYDFAFGVKRTGTIDDLQLWSKQYGIEMVVLNAQTSDQRQGAEPYAYSSTGVRSLITEGRVQEVSSALNRPYHIRGSVSHGYRRGRELGFPTANIAVSSEICPKPGVYSGWLSWGEGAHPSVISVGKNPTFSTPHLLAHQQQWSVEVHVLNMPPLESTSALNLYDRHVILWFAHQIRESFHFSGIDELRRRIEIDCQEAEHMLTLLDAPLWPL